ncbi:alpha/beta fold hydrolase [Isoptericola sp. NPDC056573]|uniref:alpha/beta fold hydrolase n=1 Tax=Isoptericola sp. NPDC056573 TaxID=3345868 RepID=UPI0036CC2E58
MGSRHELDLPDGRRLVVHDDGPPAADAVVWHHGSPQSGELLPPVVAAARARGLRAVSAARAGYGGSTRRPGRTVAEAASDVAYALDALGVDRCLAVGASGGAPHALALAALRPDVVSGVVTLAGIAPYPGPGRDGLWFAGMADDGGLRSALDGPSARQRHAETAEFDGSSFTADDYATLAGTWASLGADASRSGEAWPGGLVDDDLAFVRPWGVTLGDVTAPALVVQGGADRVVPRHHADLLVEGLPAAELWLRPRDGHVSVLTALPVAFDWWRSAA